ncbi:hypothetical protein KHP62_18700 [Rhodobacteraceae bacterium NNCM2]|nr:hypothetical protein [Coraliihabitans acroporae]
MAGLLSPHAAHAHAADQGFVLLLPTTVYTGAGVAVVALTVLALLALPEGAMRRIFRHAALSPPPLPGLRVVTSLASLVLLVALLAIGLNGPRDPLSNLMTLGVWTVFWVGLVTLAGFAGDLWRWINPWTGLYHLIGPGKPPLRLPGWLGIWPAVLVLVLFYAFLLADIAPDDPARLAYLAGGYWLATMAGLLLFGPEWLWQAEFATALFRCYGDLSALRLGSRGGIGAPGWRLLDRAPSLSLAGFALLLLAAGSFDGINETFWWLIQIDVNPLAFPGRSAIVVPTLTGLALAIAGLVAAFAAVIWLGLALARATERFGEAFARLALSLLPIAFGYHIAHYLTAALIGGQYTLAALSDPWAAGADYLGIEPFYVTTGFFNHIDSVRVIWLTQAGAVVIGHVWAVLLAHRMALDLFPEGRRAVLATAPLSLFMIGYTFLGLWLLAAPRGA